ncbi:hypothetical protein E1264_15770 [Actinomadura sp. KC216]|uniref:hypothetical protein n=1 Tax=Actinomadura sp. KC216 TaxID=2530370 RepID=UPI001049E221|nr:hypothetical protein [Actinomadura sp. KC216]TDB87073.1 hypothetical protein E1264_15770 [Actinomadura sp. KC216]
MSDATPSHDRDRAAENQAGDGQEASQNRVEGSLFQIQGTGGDVIITNTQPSRRHFPIHWTRRRAGVVAVAVTATVMAGAAWALHGPPEKEARPVPSPSSQSPLSMATTINPIQGVRSGNFGGSFIFSQPPTQLPPLPSGYLEDPQIAHGWGYRNGGVDADQTFVEVVIQGSSAKSVVLTRLLIKVQHRAGAPRATHVKVYPGADGVDGRWAHVNLDEQAPVLEDMSNHSYSGDDPGGPWSFPLRVSQEAVEVIFLNAITTKYDVQWTGELHFVADGKPGIVPITNNGKPFRTVSSENSEPYKVENGQLVPGSPDLATPG